MQDPREYERLTAIVTHTTISTALSQRYPELSIEERDKMFITILDRMARMRGYALERKRLAEVQG